MVIKEISFLILLWLICSLAIWLWSFSPSVFSFLGSSQLCVQSRGVWCVFEKVFEASWPRSLTMSPQAREARLPYTLSLVWGPGPHLGIIVNARECQTASFLFQWCEKWETGCMVRVYWLWSHCGQFGATFWRERNCGPARPPWMQGTGSHGAAQAHRDRESVLGSIHKALSRVYSEYAFS